MDVDIRPTKIETENNGDLTAGFESRMRKQWELENFNWEYDYHQVITKITCSGQDYISAGHDEMDVALAIRKVVCQFNGEWCPVDVRATYLEDQPYNEYTFTEEKYKALVEVGDIGDPDNTKE